MRRRQPRRAGADDCDLLRVDRFDRLREREAPKLFVIGDESLEGSDRDGAAQVSASAFCLARPRADSPADARQRVIFSDDGESLLEPPFGYGRDVAFRVDPDRAGPCARRYIEGFEVVLSSRGNEGEGAFDP